MKKGPKGPRVFNPEIHCGAKKRSEDRAPCRKGKGERTDHPGFGPCWIHGGRNSNKDRIKHGLTSKLYAQGPRLQEAIQRVRDNVPDPMDLSGELELVRGLLADFTGRHEELKEALIAWHLSFAPGIQVLINGGTPEEMVKAIADIRISIGRRPASVVDIESAARLASEVGRMVERIHKIKQTSAVTWEAVNAMLEQMGMVLLKHMKDPQVIDAIQRDWGQISIPTTRTTR